MFKKNVLIIALTAALTSGTCLASDTDVSQYYEDANRFFYENDLSSAMIQLKNALQLNPKHLPSLILSGDILLKQGDPAAAEYALRQAEEFGAAPSLLVANLAEAYLQQGKYRALIADFDPNPLTHPVRVTLLSYQAEALTVLGKYTDAHIKLDEAFKLDNKALLPKLAETALLLKEGKFSDAERIAQVILKDYPDDPRTWNSYASVLHITGRFSEALRSYDKALTLDHQHIDARIPKIAILVDLGRWQEAQVELDTMKTLSEGEARAAYFRGLLSEKDNPKISKENYLLAAQIIAAVPEKRLHLDSRLLMIGALSNHGLQQYEEAKNYLEVYLKRNNTDVGARKLLADVLLRLNEPEDAIRVLMAARAYASRDAMYLSLLASAYSATGRDAQSAKILEEAVKLSQSLGLRAQLAQSRIKAGKSVAKDIAQLQAMYEKNPSHQAGVTLLVHYLNQGATAKAVAIGEKLVASVPDNTTYHNLYAVALLAHGEPSKARHHFETLLEKVPDFLPAKINIAKIDMQEGQLEKAKTSLLLLNKSHTENTKVMLELARVEELQGHIEEAQQWANSAFTLDRGNLDVSLYLTNLLVGMRAYEEAESIIRTAVNANNDSLEALSTLAQVQLMQNKTQASLVTLKSMVKNAGFNTGSLYKIARLQLRAGAVKEAQYSLDKVLQVDDRHYAALVLSAELKIKQASYSEADAALTHLANVYPDNPVVEKLRGDLYLAQGELQQARTAYEQGLQLKPVDSLVVSLVHTLQKQGNIDEAITRIAKWRQVMPDSLVLQVTESELLLYKGDFDSAAKALEALVHNQPDNPYFLNNLAYAVSHNDMQKALDIAKQAYLLAPEVPVIADTYGWLQVQSGRYEEGLRYLREAAARAADKPEMQYHLGFALAKLNRISEAQHYIDKALASRFAFAERRDAQALKERLSQ